MNLEPSLRTTGTIASGQPSFTIAAPAIARVAATDALLASAALLAAATTVLVSSGPSPPGEETAAQKLDAASGTPASRICRRANLCVTSAK